jgi:methyltransferase (TIGR00027 family)
VIEGHASRTAQYMALFRALEDARPHGRRLFADPFATAFLDPLLTLVVSAARLPLLRAGLPWFIDARWPGARTSAVARTRFIDDALGRGLGSGIEQVVLLGAGFDARAYRLAGIEKCRVFEVDHPDTLARKRAAIERTLTQVPKHVTYVPTDFNERRIDDVMADAGFDPALRTFVIWEGVTNYLTEDAVDATLRWSARAAPGSHVLFTYVDRRVLDDPRSFHGTKKLFATLSDAGEKWTFGLDPGELAQFVAARGLVLEQNVGAAEYRAMYFGRSARKMVGYEFYRIALCRMAAASGVRNDIYGRDAQLAAGLRAASTLPTSVERRPRSLRCT